MSEGVFRDAVDLVVREGWTESQVTSHAQWAARDAIAKREGLTVIPMRAGGALPIIDLGDWQGDPPEREFAWGKWLPLKQTTLLTGRGGVGKSLLAQQLATAVAAGLPFLGMDTALMPVLYMTGEDEGDELWRRQIAICAKVGTSLQALAGQLHLVSLCGMTETALAMSEDGISAKPTELWAEVQEAVRHHRIGLVVIDNATDALAGDLNSTHVVATFINMLTGLAIEAGAAVLLLHHPNKRGDDFAGNEAWHNKVRSRLLLKSGEDEGDDDLRVLMNPKANYGPQGGKLLLRWHEGAFILDSELPQSMRSELVSVTRATADNELFIACLRAMTGQKRAVSERPSATFAPKVFALMPEAKGIGVERLRSAMDRLFRTRQIERGELWRGPDRKIVAGLREAVAVSAGDAPKPRADDRQRRD